MAERRLDIGCVRSVRPSQRELRVRSVAGRAARLQGMEWIRIALADGTDLRCRVEAFRAESADECVLKLAAGVTRDNVARAKGGKVFLLEEQAARGPAEGYERAAWIGLAVFDESGCPLGIVTSIYETGANDVIEIRKHSGGTLRVPVIDPVIASVDIEQGRLALGAIGPYAVEDED